MVSPLNLWVWLGWLAWLSGVFPLLANVKIESELLSSVVWYAVTFIGWVVSYTVCSCVLRNAVKGANTAEE